MKKIFRDQIWAKIGQNRSQKCFLSFSQVWFISFPQNCMQ